jgi:hypothetical protein
MPQQMSVITQIQALFKKTILLLENVFFRAKGKSRPTIGWNFGRTHIYDSVCVKFLREKVSEKVWKYGESTKYQNNSGNDAAVPISFLGYEVARAKPGYAFPVNIPFHIL